MGEGSALNLPAEVFVSSRLFSGWSSFGNGFFQEVKCQCLIGLGPGQRRMRVGNISPLLEEVKLRAKALRRDLLQRAVEIMNLLLITGLVTRAGKVALSIDDGQKRIENAPLRFAIWLQEGIAELQAIGEIRTHLCRSKPLVEILTEIRIVGIAF